MPQRPYDARIIACYVVKHVDYINYLKLPLVLYFLQAKFVSELNSKLFKDDIIATSWGVKIESIHRMFKHHGGNVIFKSEVDRYFDDTSEDIFDYKWIDYRDSLIDENDRKGIDAMLKELMPYSSTQLIQIIFNTTPYKQAYHVNASLNTVIKTEWLCDYYKD